MSDDCIITVRPLGSPPWETADPFLFCVHHHDEYPEGNELQGPVGSLAGRNIGQDFAGKDGWSIYHGDVVPGFPQHPHRGFETVTIVRRGYIDHSDSLGATARFGAGDVQWLTAGEGIVHSEMFPLRKRDERNPAELFQIWLNLPRADKFAKPHFTMLWRDAIPEHVARDEEGRETVVRVVAGSMGDAKAPPPPPKSWASRPDSDLAIFTLRLSPGARFSLPRAALGTNRTLYFFKGESLTVGDRTLKVKSALRLRPELEAPLAAGPDGAEVLVLQGKPIGEPVVAYGPFVMNSRAEIQKAVQDYQATQFGGWPWKSDGPVHAREEERFAKHADGRVEKANP